MGQSILTNATIASFGRVINVAAGVLVVALLTRFLGPAQYGLYVLLLSVGTIFQLAADAGLYLTLSRKLAEEPNQGSVLLANVFSLRTTLLLASFALGLSFIFLVPDLANLPVAFLVLALGLSFQSLGQLLLAVFQYHRVVWLITVADLTGRAGQILAVLIIGLTTNSLLGMTVAFVIGSAVTFLLELKLLPLAWPRLKIRRELWREVWQSSWPLGLLVVINAIYFRIDLIILSLFRSPSEVGWYGLAYRIIESTLFFPAMLGGLLLPRLAEAKKRGGDKLARYVNEAASLTVAAAGGVILVTLLASPQVVLLVSGTEFLGAAPLLTILGWATLALFVGHVFGFALVAYEQQKILVWFALALALFNIFANLATIPTWGAAAAAWTTVLTEWLAVILSWWWLSKTTNLSLDWPAIGLPLIPLLLALLVWLLTPSSWPVEWRMFLGLSTYLFFNWQLGIFSSSKLKLLRAV